MSCLSTNPSASHLPGGYAAAEVGEGRAPPTAQDQGHATSEALATAALAPRAWPRSNQDAWVLGQVSQGSSPRLPRDSVDLGLTPRRKTWRVQTSGGGVVDMSVVLVVFPIHMKASTSFRASATYEKTHPGRCQKTTGLSFHALSLLEIDTWQPTEFPRMGFSRSEGDAFFCRRLDRVPLSCPFLELPCQKLQVA